MLFLALSGEPMPNSERSFLNSEQRTWWTHAGASEDTQGGSGAHRVLTQDAVVTLDLDGKVLRFDAVAEGLFGYLQEEVVGHDMANFLVRPAQDEPRPLERRLVLNTDRGPILMQRLERLARRADGSAFPVELILAQLPQQGQPPTLQGYVRDLSHQRRAEEALRQSEESYRDLVENANDIIYTHDLDGKLTSWNRAGEIILGYTREEILSMNIAQIVVPEQLPRAREMIARKVVEGGRTAYELDVFAKDGRRLTMEISSRLAQQPGQTPRVQGMARDVTERKRVEAALQEADRKKDEFLAVLAHELRSPLAALRNALGVLRRTDDDPTRVEQVRPLMERQVQQLTRLVDDLLDVSRITQGKIKLRKERLDLAQVAMHAVEMCHPALQAAKVQLTLSLSPQPVCVDGDRTRLGQVLSNLLNNAAKYTPEGGQVWLVVEDHDRQAVIRVRDNGVGIPKAMLGRIFEPFTQIDESAARSQGGLGIGLTLVRQLVELHGGTVVAQSEGARQGSEFIVCLPLLFPLAASSQGMANGRDEV
jgi:PAS domain S-box-containing protein